LGISSVCADADGGDSNQNKRVHARVKAEAWLFLVTASFIVAHFSSLMATATATLDEGLEVPASHERHAGGLRSVGEQWSMGLRYA
jgi:hypothetical protein